MMIRIGITGLALLLFGCVPPEPLGVQNAEIIGGVVDLGDPAVVQVSTHFNGYIARCTGSLVSPRVVLTAAHCLDREETIDSIDVYFGTTIQGADSDYIESIDAVDRVVFNNNWDLNQDDIGLLLLARDAQTTPIEFNRTGLSTANIGDPLRLVGWGNTNGSNGTGRGTKREATTEVKSFENSDVLRYGSASANTCQGDSGGPGFMTIGGAEVIATVTSSGPAGCLGEAAGMRVAQYASFIDDFIATRDGATPPMVSITEPADGDHLASGFSVSAIASDNTRVDRVELWMDGMMVGARMEEPYTFTTPAVDGLVELEVRAYDNRGDEAVAQIEVEVDSSCSGEECEPDPACVEADCQESGGCTASGTTGSASWLGALLLLFLFGPLRNLCSRHEEA